MESIVWIIIAVAAVVVARRYIGIFRGTAGCCGDAPCGDGKNCCPGGGDEIRDLRGGKEKDADV